MIHANHAKPFAALVVAVLALGAFGALPATAQLQTGDLVGTARDEQGGALPGVTITLTGIGAPRVQTTNENGSFRFIGLFPGIYQLAAELEGFSSLEYPDVAVRVGGTTNLELTLSSAITDAITVTSASPLLDERQVNRGATVHGRRARQRADRARSVVAARLGARRPDRPGQRRRQRERPAVQFPRTRRLRLGEYVRRGRRDSQRHGGGRRLGHLLRLRRLRRSAVHDLQRRRHHRHRRRHHQPGHQARHQRLARRGPLPAHRRPVAVRADRPVRQQDRPRRGVRRQLRRPAC